MNPLFSPILAEFPPSLWHNLTGPDGSVDIGKLGDISQLLANIIQIALTVAGVLAVGFIIWAGIQYIYSQGNSGGVEKAKNTLVNAIVGLILVVLAYAIVGYVAGVFGG